jgi:multidrug efflux pump subunit AcrA (membrane-fusion protein)
MKLKKIALRGMIILAVVIALCVLFSGTIRSLTTAKVQRASVKNGKFENTIQLSSKVAFPEKEEMKITVPDGLSLTVQRVPMAAGQKVKKGETLLYTQLSDGEKTITELEKKYDEARSAIEDWDRKHGDIRLTRNEEAWVNAYDAARQADKDELNLRQSLMAVMNITNSADFTDENVKKILKGMSQSVGQPILDDYREWKVKKEELAKAREKLKSLDRYAVSDDVWTTLKSKRDAQDNLKEAEDKLMQIRTVERQMAEIKAPYDCYVIEMKVKKGDTLNGESEVANITAEGKDPVLRASIDSKTNVQKGTAVTIPVKSYWARVETKIIAIGVDDEGKQYADAEINGSVTDALGNVSSMMRKEEIKLKITTRAKESSCMVKTAAIIKEGDERYVYTVSQTDSPLGGVRITVDKVAVTVIAENEDWTSIQENFSDGEVVYLPDRPINKGDTVMFY